MYPRGNWVKICSDSFYYLYNSLVNLKLFQNKKKIITAITISVAATPKKYHLNYKAETSLVPQMVKNLPAMWETQV